MVSFLRSRGRSFRYAFAGWRHALRTQPNTWIHATATLAVGLLAWWLDLDTLEWAVLVLVIALVWTAELINTALEAAVDLANPQQHALAQVAKDAGAGAVLAAALGSVVIGLLILGPPLWARIQSILTP
ncbi:MAG TPA: diacylglycerol kinase family protein [Anaerolineales bacterium]|nr:diacylglycerol kinase family protein [Anaerolineales bacterium]